MKVRKAIFVLSLVLLATISMGARPVIAGSGDTALAPLNRSQDMTRRLKIKEKPEAEYTEEAKRNGIEGKVVLRIEFGADGKIGDIKPVHELPNGLTQKAIEAAKLIKFEPALKDGQPVMMWLNVVYKFKLGN
jgi:TonB family protein